MSTSAGPNIVEDGLVLYIDPANQKSYSSNMFQFSTDFYSFASTASSRATASRDNIESPVGNTPLKLTQTATGGRAYTNSYNNALYNISPAAAGETWTLSYWAKSSIDNPGTGASYIFGANSSGVAFVDGAWLNISGKGQQYTTEWQRFTHTFTFTNPDVAYIHIRVDTDNDAAIGHEFWFDGFQVEKSSSATPFNPNYYGSIVKDIVSENNLTVYGSPEFTSDLSINLANNNLNEYLMNSNFPNPTEEVTYSIWFKSRFTNPVQTPFTYSVGGNNEMLFYISNSTTISPHSKGSVANFAVDDMTNRWINFVWTSNRITGDDVYYINGEVVGTRNHAPGSLITTNGYLIIGEEADSPGGGFATNQDLDGEFSNMSVYNKVLTSSEIKQNFNALRGRYEL
jgi:hypothetical protein